MRSGVDAYIFVLRPAGPWGDTECSSSCPPRRKCGKSVVDLGSQVSSASIGLHRLQAAESDSRDGATESQRLQCEVRCWRRDVEDESCWVDTRTQTSPSRLEILAKSIKPRLTKHFRAAY